MFIEYKKGEREKILQEQEAKGLIFKGERNISEGNFFIFMTKEEILDREIRPIRNQKLADTDYLMLADNVERLTPEEYEEIKMYRQSLRDITKQSEPVFPDIPDCLKTKITSE